MGVGSDNDVRIVVDAEFKGAPAFGQATKGAKTVGDVAERAGAQVKAMGDKLEAANTKARQLALAEEKAAEKARRLAQDLALAKRELAQSGDETGQLARKVDRLSTDLRFAAIATEEYRRSANHASSEAREQARAYDRVADNARQAARAVALLGAASVLSPGGGKGGGGGALSEISSGFLKNGLGGASAALEGVVGTPVVGPAALAGGLLAGVGASFFAGGAAGGAVGLGGALGVAGGGLASAWMSDPDKYDAKWAASTDRTRKRWIESSKAFGNELDGVLKIADQTLRNLPIEKALALSQSFVLPIAEGAGSGVSAAADGFVDSLERAQPIVDEVGPKIADLGHDVGDMFRAIAGGSDGGAQALGDLIDLVGFLAKATGNLVLGFELGYERIRKFAVGAYQLEQSMSPLGGILDDVAGGLFGLGNSNIVLARELDDGSKASSTFAGGLLSMVKAGAEAELQALALNDALTQTRNTMLAMADANLGVAQGWLDLGKGLKDGAKSLDLNTQAGIDNQRVIIDQVSALERQREQAIATSDGTVEAMNKADAAYAAGIDRIRAMAHALHFTDEQVDQLIASLGAIPPKVDSQVTVKGLGTSLAQGISLGNALNNLDGRTYSARVSISMVGGWVLDAVRGVTGHAAGGATSSGLSRVNDWGGAGIGEIMRLPNGSTVIPAGTGRQIAREIAGGGSSSGGGTQVVELRVTGNGGLAELLMRMQRSGDLQILSTAIV